MEEASDRRLKSAYSLLSPAPRFLVANPDDSIDQCGGSLPPTLLRLGLFLITLEHAVVPYGKVLWDGFFQTFF